MRTTNVAFFTLAVLFVINPSGHAQVKDISGIYYINDNPSEILEIQRTDVYGYALECYGIWDGLGFYDGKRYMGVFRYKDNFKSHGGKFIGVSGLHEGEVKPDGTLQIHGRNLVKIGGEFDSIWVLKSHFDEDPVPQREGLTGGKLVFQDDFNRTSLGERWSADPARWTIHDGMLHSSAAKNSAAWLNDELPKKMRVEFTAQSHSSNGDLKCEIFAREKVHSTGYILILGGWNNSITVLARLDEHALGRLETTKKLVTIGKKHRFVIIRTDATIRWYLDGVFLMSFSDSKPLIGRFFGFNNWESDVYFDDLRIYDLE